MLKQFMICVVALLMAGIANAQEKASRQIAPRIEIHPIPTLTLTDQQFLKGATDGKPAQVAGEFRIAQGSGRLPVVVLMHGSSGVGGNVDAWSKEFAEMGISTFIIDGFSGRGLSTVGPDQSKLGRLNFIIDIYRSLEILAKHPRVDTSKIVLMGFSRGGQAALYASLKRFHQMWNKSGIEFAAYIPFYPDCSTTYMDDAVVADKPIRIFGGAMDDYNPVAACKTYAARLKAAGRNIDLIEYPNAPHSFDNPLGAVPSAVSKDAQTVRRCAIREESGGVLINAETKQPFSYKDACVELNPHVGYDAAATSDAKIRVAKILETVTGYK